ncbi:2'-5' RNA ligase family protein [Chryseobacterium sp. PBS4-4]|uniref:2'-5' RNA ligase family protein n=1 Tax=Chryseobacterium edaphi TaxID=2976532 RepID=A0ABT2W9E9_9FLAO|nr:2'-5' RNA ligase family protein [Chryseobacterium edaphi]MCU7618837.1 2'-5' RNA ligase family protein [Chryseobacterium edaphi]
MKIPYTYSIIFHPLSSTIGEVIKFKKDLTSKAGDYASQNSLAHITIAGFEATENQLTGVKEYLKKFVENMVPFTTLFNQLSCSAFSKCAVFLPSFEFNDRIHNITKNVRNIIPVKEMSKISPPHVSIGRDLSEEQLTIALQFLNSKSFKFDCCQLALRKFDPNTGQYEIIQEFSFTGKPNQENFRQTSIDWDF